MDRFEQVSFMTFHDKAAIRLQLMQNGYHTIRIIDMKDGNTRVEAVRTVPSAGQLRRAGRIIEGARSRGR